MRLLPVKNVHWLMPSQCFHKPTEENYPGNRDQEQQDAIEHYSQNREQSFAFSLKRAHKADHQTHKVYDRPTKPAKHDEDEEDFIVRLIVDSAVAYSRNHK